ncbi:hypothetical protein [Ileibacterium valens]|uniref:hypothetical protein n=1 Tax=Ileibacterium valens TaxID=1862668 RepID=UPI00257062B6|nr:hypothetical protein [Ileibacterium valens]
MLTSFEVGSVIQQFIGIEGVFCDISENGMTLFFSFPDPTPKEKSQLKSGSTFAMRSGIFDDILMFAMKPGSLPWADAYWVPTHHLQFEELEPSFGMLLTIILIDGRDGRVISIRAIRLPHTFSMTLIEQIKDVQNVDHDIEAVHRTAMWIQSKYSTDNLKFQMKNRCEIRG